MKNRTVKVISGILACSLTAGVLAGCGGTTGFDNEETPLVFSTQALDGVFNPFFSTSATDGNVAGLTQIGMLANDEKGNVVYGDKEAVVVKDLQIETTYDAATGEPKQTEYKFVLKNNVRFSDASYLSIKDVLFNLYVYLDPAYTGSSTIYSTDIVGLKAYRTQSEQESEQDDFKLRFENNAKQRINDLKSATTNIFKNHDGTVFTKETFREQLQAMQDNAVATSSKTNLHLVDDYDKALELFREELEADWSNSLESYADTVFQDERYDPTTGVGLYHDVLKSDGEMFLYNEGVISWDKKTAQIIGWPGDNLDEESTRTWDKNRCIDYVFGMNIPNKLTDVIQYWMTAGELRTYLTNAEMEDYFKNNPNKSVPNISGIKFANRTEPVTVNGTQYGVPSYEEGSNNTHVVSGNEVLSITINEIDPKAIWNFAFAVAPMYYYSDQAHINAFDYESNFGVEYGSQSFLDEVVGKNNGVPVGAGPYAASKNAGGITGIEDGDFFDGSLVYFERNPYYVMGPAKIKKVRYQVSEQNQMLNQLYAHGMDFVEPNAKPETFTEVQGREKEGIGYKELRTAGYGYIGINAGKVPSLAVRQAIMHCVDTKMTSQYYGSHASTLFRSMTKESWVYDLALTDKIAYYPYVGDPVPSEKALDKVSPNYKEWILAHGKKEGDVLTEAEQIEFIRWLVTEKASGYSENSAGVYTNGRDTLKYRFTIVGSDSDHPAMSALRNAQEILNKCGFSIDVKTDSQGLVKLNTGDLTVWAAAWGSTIDPDMYQVYHKDSTATSVLNWGYRQILLNAGNRYDTENGLLDELADLIDEGRKIDDSTPQGKKERANVYADALDKVMELAVELPTYQRTDLFVYNSNKIDASTFFQNATSFKGLTSEIHTVSLRVE